MVGKMMSNKKWSGASKYAKEKFGSTLNDLISARDSGDKGAQSKLNEAIRAGGEAERSSRVGKMEADVMSDYNAKVDENARNRMAVANKVLDKTAEASLDVLDEGRKAVAEVESRKKKKTTEYAGE